MITDNGGGPSLDGEEEGHEKEGVEGPRRSQREMRGVPPLRFVELLMAIAKAANGEALANMW